MRLTRLTLVVLVGITAVGGPAWASAPKTGASAGAPKHSEAVKLLATFPTLVSDAEHGCEEIQDGAAIRCDKISGANTAAYALDESHHASNLLVQQLADASSEKKCKEIVTQIDPRAVLRLKKKDPSKEAYIVDYYFDRGDVPMRAVWMKLPGEKAYCSVMICNLKAGPPLTHQPANPCAPAGQ